ncbi:hypothetical protein COJ96_19410 [Bacillus sp. AFS073361]|uniref:CPBP family intramembrane glutamic endopeptidase n=1 Tax=Bacillus sp. AFS073361 TaxID=2033511 RepID=UPI000BF84287|nr:CPBP family intramembrane glutamic endopeptidase [Bacillus sp. AFS073361]PFP25920.1 hypothetical protein COJ96_19410 [Bacillus sp. AFS073361]
MRILKNVSLFFLASILLMLTIMFLNDRFNLGISDNDIDIFLGPSIMLIYFWIVSPDLRKHFYIQFIRVKAFDRVVLLPVLLAILVLFLLYSYFYFPALFAKEPLSVGNAQYLGHQELTTAGEILLLGIIGPFSEEFLFRFFLIVYLPYLALHHTFIKKPLETKKNVNKSISKPFIFLVNVANKVYYRVFEKKDKKLISSWVILVSCFFAFVHGPDLYSFPLYFLPGILFSFVYLKYGFLASWICHGTANTLSGIVNAIFISFLNGR